jgi:peptidoglycan/LPS O-acetylase OafA/YrhL
MASGATTPPTIAPVSTRDSTILTKSSLGAPHEGSGRIRSLDGLRGIAALIVVVDHSLISNPNFLQYLGPPSGPRRPGTIAWWVAYSPLHIFWSGLEAVFVFFVLSGLVLALPWASGPRTGPRRPTWVSYYPRRAVRLYIPVFGAVALAAANLALVPRHIVAGSGWLSGHTLSLTWARVLHDAYLLHGTDNLNGPLWSLEWEVVFSIALPLFIIGGKFWRRAWPFKLLALMVAITVGWRINNPSLEYLPMFGFGVLMAFHWDELRAFVDRHRRKYGEQLFAYAAVVAVLLILSTWLLYAIGPLKSYTLFDPDIAHVLAGVGSAMVVFLAANWSRFQHFCELPAVQWVGKRSFSLYLVHEPLLVSIAFLLGGRPNTAVLLAIVLPVALLVADIFYRVVERPAIQLSHVVGGWARPKSARSAAPGAGADPVGPRRDRVGSPTGG